MPDLLAITNGGGIASMASGPAGVILLGRDGVDRRPFVVRSTDGQAWVRTDLADDTFGGGLPRHVVSGGPGYVAIGYEVALSAVYGSDPVVWLSADGLNWMADPSASGWFRDMDLYRLDGLANGDLFASLGAKQGCCAKWAMSPDGAEWQAFVPPVEDPVRYEAGPGGMVVSAEVDPTDDLTFATTTRVWYSPDLGSWRELPALETPWIALSHSPIDFVVGESILALDRNVGDPNVFEEIPFDVHVLRGEVWRRVQNPIGPSKTDEHDLMVASPTGGFVALRGRWRESLDEPVSLWVSPDGISWEEQRLDEEVWAGTDLCVPDPLFVWLEDQPIITLCDAVTGNPLVLVGRPDVHREVLTHATVNPLPAPGPPPERIEPACPDIPRSIRDLLDLSPGAGARCYGDRPITVRAWNADRDFDAPVFECGPWSDDPGRWWILDPCRRKIFAVGPWWETDDDLILITIDPSAAVPRRSTWYRVTGHFDDPVAEDCGARMMPANEPGHEPPGAWVNECRATFVGTDFVQL